MSEGQNKTPSNEPGLGCDPKLVKRFVGSGLTDHELAELEDHLESCPVCQSLIETETTAPESWSEACFSLRDNRGWYSAGSTGAGDDGTPESDSSNEYVKRLILKSLAPSKNPEMIGRIGDYEISGVIGHGGMGIVLKAHDASLNRLVALKVLRPYLAISGAARQRFFREARAAATIIHDNVMPIHSVGESDDELPYLVMPYVRGETLQQRIARTGAFPPDEVVRIGMQVASGLSAAHEQGLVHRDIKPANIILEDGVDKLWITDFGLARLVDDASLTRTGVITGTPEYMSPEQAKGESVDERSDLFSLGALMYTGSTGHPPFRAPTSYGVLRRITDDQPRPIRETNEKIPAWLDRFILKLLSKEPSDRIGDASEVASLLKESLAHLRRPTAFELPKEIKAMDSAGSKRNFGWMLAAVLLLAVGLFGVSKFATGGNGQLVDGRVTAKVEAVDGLEISTPSLSSSSGSSLSESESESESDLAAFDPRLASDTQQVTTKPEPVGGYRGIEAMARSKRTSGFSSQRFLPIDTPVWFTIRDPRRFTENLSKTQIGKLLNSFSMNPFVLQFKSDWRRLLQEKFVPLPEGICRKQWVSGEVTFGFIERVDVLKRRKSFSPFAFIDVEESDAEAFEDTKAEFAQLEDARQSPIELGNGDTLCMTSFGPAARRKKVIFGVAKGWLVIGENAGLVDELLRFTRKGRGDCLSKNPSFKKSMIRSEIHVPSDIIWFANPLKVAELLTGSEAGKPASDHDWLLILRSQGFDLFSGAGGRIAFATSSVEAGEQEMIHRSFICNSAVRTGSEFEQLSKQENALGLFDFTNSGSPVTPPDWVPFNAASCLTADWDKRRAVKSMGPIYDAFIDEEGSWDRLLSDFKVDPDMRLDIVKLAKQFDSRVSLFWNSSLPGTTTRPVIGFDISGDREMVLESLRRATGGTSIRIAGFKGVFVKGAQTEVDGGAGGGPDYSILENADGKKARLVTPTPSEAIFSLPGEETDPIEETDPTGDRFYVMASVLLVSDSKDLLWNLLAEKKRSLRYSEDYGRVHNGTLAQWAADEDVNIRHFGRLDSSLREHYRKFRTGEFEWFDWIAKAGRSKLEDDPFFNIDAPKPVPRRKRIFDGSMLPEDFDVEVARFLGPYGWVLETEGDGWTITGCLLKKKADLKLDARIKGGFRPREAGK